MAAPRTGACEPWATAADVPSPCDDYAIDAALMDGMLDAATDVLFEKSGRRFPGTCATTVRPCCQRRDSGAGARRITGSMTWGTCSCRGDHCGLSRRRAIGLGTIHPIVDVTEVKVDGTTLDPSLYGVRDHGWLVRLPDADGTTPGWPCCQRLDLAATEDDTFEVSYSYGLDPPQAGIRAAAALACELYQSADPETFGDCRLPPQVRSLTRQGVAMDLQDLAQLLSADVLSALPTVRTFLAAYPGPPRPAGVLSPDVGPEVARIEF